MTTRGMPIKLLSRAYWVAVNFLLVRVAMNATYAVVAMPLNRFSLVIANANPGKLWPSRAKITKPISPMACSTPNSHSARYWPSRSINTPPISPPTTVAQKPNNFTMVPISVLLKPISN